MMSYLDSSSCLENSTPRVYSEVAKMFKVLHLRRDKMIPWKLFFLAMRLELSREHILLVMCSYSSTVMASKLAQHNKAFS